MLQQEEYTQVINMLQSADDEMHELAKSILENDDHFRYFLSLYDFDPFASRGHWLMARDILFEQFLYPVVRKIPTYEDYVNRRAIQ